MQFIFPGLAARRPRLWRRRPADRPPPAVSKLRAAAACALAPALLLTAIAAPQPASAETVVAPGDAPALTTRAEIASEDLMAHIRALASEAMAGRKTGEPGGARAEAYVAAAFRRLGLAPAGEKGGYFQRFDFVSGVRLGSGARLEATRRDRRDREQPADEAFPPLTLNVDWRPLGYSRIGAAPPRCVVFAGFGLRLGREGAPDHYDSYAGRPDLGGCWALVWRGAPPEMERSRLAGLLRVAGIPYKAAIARAAGASGLIVADGPGVGHARGLPPLRFGPRMQREALPVLALTEPAAQKLLRLGGVDPARQAARLRKGAALGRPKPLSGVSVSAMIDLEVERSAGRNVVGRLELAGKPEAPPLLVGAHLDHLGRGGGFSSLARARERGMIHFGADDNASGVAAILEIAERLATQRKALAKTARRDVVFGAWMGEELGLLGSAAYVAWLRDSWADRVAPPPPAAAYVNLDMVGRLDQRLTVSGVGSSPDWLPALRVAAAGTGLPIALEDNAYLPTDATSFFLAGAPVLSLSTGQHPDYHSPRDRPEAVNAEGLRKIASLIDRILRRQLGSTAAPRFQAMQAKSDRAGVRRGGVSLGVAPAFAPGEIVGAPLLGVVKGGPAAEAGLASGDVLIELAGRRLVTLYDLVLTLDGLAPGRPVEAVFRRGKKTLRRQVTPRRRE